MFEGPHHRSVGARAVVRKGWVPLWSPVGWGGGIHHTTGASPLHPCGRRGEGWAMKIAPHPCHPNPPHSPQLPEPEFEPLFANDESQQQFHTPSRKALCSPLFLHE